MATLYRIVAVVGLGLATSCARPNAPAATLAAYREALAQGRYGQAYQFMATPYQKQVSAAEFAHVLTQNPGEVRATVAQLGQAGSVRVEATLTLADGGTVRLVQEADHWRVVDTPMAYYDQATPRAALRSFVRAFRAKNWQAMLRLVPTAYRANMTPARLAAKLQAPAAQPLMTKLVTMLEANLEAHIAQDGATATMPYGEAEARFVFEDGVWRILDLD